MSSSSAGRTRPSSTRLTASDSEGPQASLLAAWSAVRAVDHHCHPLQRTAALEANEFRGCFTEATDPRVLAAHIPNTPLYRLLLRRLAPVFGCQPTEAAILTARRMLEPARYARELMAQTCTEMLLLDTGFAGRDTMTLEEHGEVLALGIPEIVRLEPLAESLLA